MRFLFLVALSLGITISTSAQSISGNLNTGTSMSALGYGNVDIYRGDELIASLLTDRYGNYTVRLDTGTYVCVVSYDGYAPITRTVQVRADEKVDLSMAEDGTKSAHKRRPFEGSAAGASEPAMEGTVRVPSPWIGETMLRDAEGPSRDCLTVPTHAMRNRTASRGILTAGEVNDFSKWEQWGDLSATTLSAMRNVWRIAPEGRYTLDLQSTNGLPIADAIVFLKGKGGRVLFSARTDNTGKAELWAALSAQDTLAKERKALEVYHQGRMFRVDRAELFQQGVNRLVIDVPCTNSDNVDVAFVVDATGSMQDELDFLRAEMNDIIYRSKQIGDKLNFRFANVFYRDHGDEYLTRSMDFSRVLSAAVNFISDQGANGGGDTPEAVDVALDSAINHLSWSSEARARIIFLVLDASPHPGTQERMQELIRQAASKGIRIVTVAASGIDKGTEYLMRTLALGTNGTYTFLTDHSGVGSTHLEPTTDHYDVESLNDLLVRVLKSYTYMPDCKQQIPELELNYPDSLVLAPNDSLLVDSTATAIKDSLSAGSTIRWSYYPNPTTGIVNITAEVDITELYITDLSGKLLQLVKGLKAGQAMQVDLSSYATGIYLIRYPYGGSWLSGKVMLQRS